MEAAFDNPTVVRGFADRFDMIAPEWRAFGDSDDPGPGTGTAPDQLAEDLNAFLDTLGLARVGLVAHVVVAVDSVEGLEQLERCHPAAVLCDIAMPGMDGLEFATRMRTDSGFAACP